MKDEVRYKNVPFIYVFKKNIKTYVESRVPYQRLRPDLLRGLQRKARLIHPPRRQLHHEQVQVLQRAIGAQT